MSAPNIATTSGPAPGCFGLLGVSLTVDPAMSDADRLSAALCLTQSACGAFENITGDADHVPGWWSALYTLRQAVIVLNAPCTPAAAGAAS
ncbi:MAG: hypothetical protein RLZZ182_674 [Pseudomonadota bacterium]|jgi:hypothetical protein